MNRRLLTLALATGLLMGGGSLAPLPAAADPAPPLTTSTDVVATPATTPVGGAVLLSATVGTPGDGLPAGDVTFHRVGDSGPADDVVVPLPETSASPDSATVTATVHPGSAGTHQYLATYVPADGTWATSQDTADVTAADAVEVTITVPETVGRGTRQPVQITATDLRPGHEDEPVEGTATVHVDDSPVADLVWTDGATTFEHDAGATGPVTVTADFEPADAATYGRPGPLTVSFDVAVFDTETALTGDPADPLAGGDLELTVVVESEGPGAPTGAVEITRSDADPGEEPLELALPETGPGVGADAVTVSTTVQVPRPGAVSYVATYVPTADAAWNGSVSEALEVDAGERTAVATVEIDPRPAVRGRESSVTVTAVDEDSGLGVLPDEDATSLEIDGIPVVLSWTGADGVGVGAYTPTSSGDQSLDLVFVPESEQYGASRVPTDAQLRVVHPTSTEISPLTASPLVKDRLDLAATVTSSGHGLPTGRVEFVDLGDPGDPADDAVVGTDTSLVAEQVEGEDSTDTVTASISLVVTDGDRSYVARFVADGTPTTATYADSVSTLSSDITPVKRPVALTLTPADVPAVVDAATEVTVTATDPADDDAPVEGSATLVIGGVEVDLEWQPDGSATGDWVPAASGDADVELHFTPTETDTFADPPSSLPSLRVVDATTTTLTVSETSPLIGDPVTVVATVRATTGSVTPTGTVEVTVSGSGDEPLELELEPTDTDGVARAETEVTPTDTVARDYRASYATPDATHAASSSTVDAASRITARQRTMTVVPTYPTGAHRVDTELTVTVALSDLADADRAIAWSTGLVTVTVGDTVLDDPTWADQTATFRHTPDTVGSFPVTIAVTPGPAYATPPVAPHTLVVKQDQHPVATVPTGPHVVGTPVTVSVTGSYGDVEITRQPGTADSCTVSGTQVTPTRAPRCYLQVVADGDTTHLPSEPVLLDFAVAPKPVTVTVTVTPRESVYGAPRVVVSATARVTGTSTDLPGEGMVTITPRSGGTGISLGSYTFGGDDKVISETGALRGAGEYTAEITYAPLATDEGVYEETSGSRDFDIAKAAQEVRIDEPADHLYVGQTWEDVASNVTVPGTAVELEIVSPDGEPAICEVVDETDVRFLRPGDCSILARAPESTNYNEDEDDEIVTVEARPVAVQLTATGPDPLDPTPRYGSDVTVEVSIVDELSLPDTVEVVVGDGMLQVVGADDPDATVSEIPVVDGVAEGEISPKALGTHGVAVEFVPDLVDGIERYQGLEADPAAPHRTFEVERGKQQITWDGSHLGEDQPYDGGGATVDVPWDGSVTGGASDQPVELDSETPAICTTSGLDIVVVAAVPAGTACVVVATQEGGDYHLDAPESRITLTPRLRPVTVSVELPDDAVYGAGLRITATATDDLAAGPVPEVPVPLSDPAVTRSGTGELTVSDEDGAVETYPLVYRAGRATIAEDFEPPAAGDYEVSATFVPTRQHAYLVTATPGELGVDLAVQTIEVATVPGDRNIGDVWDPEAAGGDSLQPVTMTIVSTDVCGRPVADPPLPEPDEPDLTPGPIELWTLGECKLIFRQDGTPNQYDAAEPVEVTITVERRKILLTVTPAAGGRTYETGSELRVAATELREPDEPVPGRTTVAITDLTDPDDEAPANTDGTLELDQAAGTAAHTVSPRTLLAGSYRITYTFTPDEAAKWAVATVDEPLSVALATQSFSAVGSPPSPARVSEAWTPVFTVLPAAQQAVALAPGGPNAADWFPEYDDLAPEKQPTVTCRTADGIDRSAANDPAVHDHVVQLWAEGTCLVDAQLPEMPRRYAASAVTQLTVAVTRRPTDLTIVVPEQTLQTPDWPRVDEAVSVAAVARAAGRAAQGTGEFSVARRLTDGSYQELPDLPLPAAEWFGGGQFHQFLATHAGTYRVIGAFRPKDPVTVAPPAGADTTRYFEIDLAAQPITVPSDVPETAKVHETWSGTATGGASGNPVGMVVDETKTTPVTGSAPGVRPYACYVTAAGVLRFAGHGDCYFRYVQAGVPGRYAEGRSAELHVEVAQTETTVDLVGSSELEVGVPTTFTATARTSDGTATGSGPLELRKGGATMLSVPGTWRDGVGTFVFTPAEAIDGLSARVEFTPADPAAFAGSTGTLPGPITIETGTQRITVTDAPTAVYIGDTWDPRPQVTGPPDADLTVTVTPSTPDGCVLGSGGVISFDKAGTCAVSMSLPQVAGSHRPLNWTAATWASGEIEVRTHPVTVLLTVDEDALLYSHAIPVRAQVLGKPRGAGDGQYVPGRLSFLVDGEPAIGVDQLPLPAVEVDATGVAAREVWITRSTPPVPADDRHTIRVRFVPDEPGRWSTDSAERTYPIARQSQSVDQDASPPIEPLRVGQTWTPRPPTVPRGRDASVVVHTDETTGLCTTDGAVVTITGASTAVDTGTDAPRCDVSFSAAGDSVYAPEPAQLKHQLRTLLRQVQVTTEVAPAAIHQQVGIEASVIAPAVPGDPARRIGAAPQSVPEGTVTFSIAGTDQDDPITQTVPLVAGRAVFTSPYRPSTAATREVTATFTPTTALRTVYDTGVEGTGTLGVAKVATTTEAPAVSATAVQTRVARSVVPRATLGGQVLFSWAPLDDLAATTELGRATVGTDGIARLGTVPTPSSTDVRITAAYLGDDNHLASTATRDRRAPTITASPARVTGWQSKPVRITFTCTRGSAALDVACPAPYVFRADQRNGSVTRTVTAADGSSATVSVTGVNIDQTAPSITLTGVRAGQRFVSTPPSVGCRTSDAMSGSTCRVRFSRTIDPGELYAGKITATATATDAAGNTRVARATYELLQAWVRGAPDVRGGYQVRPRKKVRIVARTEGAQPQLMLPNGTGGKLRPRAVFKASGVNDGIVSWYAVVTVPRGVKVGRSWRIGYRLSDAPARIIRIRLDVVRKPGSRVRR